MVSNYRDKPGVFQPHGKPAAGMAANTRSQRTGWQVDLDRVQAIVEDTAPSRWPGRAKIMEEAIIRL